jgi:hypothetical protein
MRFDIAGATRISVIAPRSADIARAFKDNKVFDALLLQAYGCAQPAEAAADDRDARIEDVIFGLYLVTSFKTQRAVLNACPV